MTEIQRKQSVTGFKYSGSYRSHGSGNERNINIISVSHGTNGEWVWIEDPYAEKVTAIRRADLLAALGVTDQESKKSMSQEAAELLKSVS